MKRAILSGSIAILIMLAAAAPAFACPTKQCFILTIATISVSNPNAPGTETPTNNGGLIGSDVGVIDSNYAIALGYSTSYETDWTYLNTNTFTGGGLSVATSSTYHVESLFTFNGLGAFIYNGPDFNVPSTIKCDAISGPAKVSTGETFFGLLVSGPISIQFTSGPYAGETGTGKFAGVGYPDGSGIYVATYTIY